MIDHSKGYRLEFSSNYGLLCGAWTLMVAVGLNARCASCLKIIVGFEAL